jgi:hypothetical protein
MASLSVAIRASGVEVAPGGSATFTVEVRNLGTVVDRYRCDIVGLDPQWVSITPPSLELFPSREGEDPGRAGSPPTVGRFSVTVRPPRISAATAGPWPLGARVSSENDPTARAVEEATIVILPFGELHGELRPALLRGRFGASTRIELANRGNRPESLTISGSDRAGRIDFKIEQANLVLRPGDTTSVRVGLGSGDIRLVGGSDTRPFTIDIRSNSFDTPPLALSGSLERLAIVPAGVPVGLAVVAALAMGSIATGLVRLPGTAGAGDSPLPSATSVANASPTATPSPTPTPSPSPSPSKSSTPSAAPPVTCTGQFQVDQNLRVDATTPTITAGRRLCILRLDMFTPGSGSGPVRLLVAGHEILRFDMAEYDSVGTEGAGSGERSVTFDPGAGVKSGDKIKLDLAGCVGDGCDGLGISIGAANAP